MSVSINRGFVFANKYVILYNIMYLKSHYQFH